jgi:hypothetical protein
LSPKSIQEFGNIGSWMSFHVGLVFGMYLQFVIIASNEQQNFLCG